MRSLGLMIIPFFSLIFASACFAPREELPIYSREVARVGDYQIKEDYLRFRLKLELNKFPKGYVEKYRQRPLDEQNRLKPVLDQVLSKMVEDYAILSYGQTKNIVITDEELKLRFEKRQSRISPKDLENTLGTEKIPYHRWKRLVEDQLRVEFVLEKVLGDKLNVTLSEIQNYYGKNRGSYKTKESARIRHIVTDTKDKADEILVRLEKNENFAQLAVNHSISPDRARGGDLGYIERGTYPEVFDKAFELEKGNISGVIKSKYGYHIFKLIDKKPPGVRPLDEVMSEIQQKLFEEKLKTHYKKWIEDVRKDVTVVVHEDILKSFAL